MTPLSPLDRFLLLASVGGMFASVAFYAAARTARFWKAPFARFARASRPVQAAVLAGLLAVTTLGGGKTNAPPLRLPPRTVREIPVQDLPAWFVALGYPAADADGSGIPDCWERWTHTSGSAADADPDGDGLANLDEFEAQTDPRCADTDGDGLDDATELAGLAAGVADLDPLAPATFAANEPDADGDGVPDLWEDCHPWTFDGVDDDGFPLGFDFPEAAGDNYDVRATVSSSRRALLSWGGGEGESVLLPACTNLSLRLRLSADDARTLSLSPSPNSATNPAGTWRAALTADWDERRGLPTENDRAAVADGTMVDRSERESVAVEAWVPQQALRSGGPRRGRGRRAPAIAFTPRSLSLVHEGTYCPVHGSDVVFTVVATNAAPPYVWTEDGNETETQDCSYRPTGSHEVRVRWKDSFSRLFVSAADAAAAVGCRPGRTNLLGAAWTSTHDPDDPSDHAPGTSTNAVAFGPFCPPAQDVDVRLGWTHDRTILHIRNLVRIITGDAAYDSADHCIGIEWKKGGEIDLFGFLDETTLPFSGDISFLVNGKSVARFLAMGRKPNILRPAIYNVSVAIDGEKRLLDTMVLTVFAPEEKTLFSAWRETYADTGWAKSLPQPPRREPARQTASWYAPGTPGAYMHHDAAKDMRSKPVSGGHGHQATYDHAGMLITNGTIAAGTADFVSPESMWNGTQQAHREQDVKPYIWALHLDGNPGRPDNTTGLATSLVPSRLSRPCIYQGENIEHYIELRPSTPTGIKEQ